MFKKWKVLQLIALMVFLSVNVHADELFSFKGGYQVLSPEGSIAGTVDGVGEKIDVEDDLNLDDSEEFTGEFALNWGNSRLSLNYLPIDFSGNGTLSKTFEINEQIFAVNTTVQSDLTIDLYDFGYTYYFLNIDDASVRLQLGPEISLKVADADFSIEDTGLTGESESESVIAAIPTVGARARVAFSDFVGVIGRIGYMEINDNHFLDAEAQVEFSPVPFIGIYVGYRYFDLKIDEEELYVETDISGPFGGVQIRF